MFGEFLLDRLTAGREGFFDLLVEGLRAMFQDAGIDFHLEVAACPHGEEKTYRGTGGGLRDAVGRWPDDGGTAVASASSWLPAGRSRCPIVRNLCPRPRGACLPGDMSR